MEYQKNNNKKWKFIDNLYWMYSDDSQSKFKASLLRSSLYDYSDAYVSVSGTTKIAGEAADDAIKWTDGRDKRVSKYNLWHMV